MNLRKFILPIALLTLTQIPTINASHQYNDPIGDYLYSGNLSSGIKSPIEPIEIVGLDAYYNETHFIITMETMAKVDPEPAYPEMYQFSLAVIGETEIDDLISEIYVDNQSGWNVYGLIDETEKIVSGVKDEKYTWLIRRDISDLGGNPESVSFIVWTIYENPEPQILRIYDVAPQQNETWIPPYAGTAMGNSTYFTLNFTSTLSQENEETKIQYTPTTSIPGFTNYTIIISIVILITTTRKRNQIPT